MIKSRKGQLSIETMIIYGLIALVALSAVAALIYFDVLNLGRYLPDRCNIGGSGDLKCEEIKVSSTSNEIVLGIRNVAQKPIESFSLTITETSKVHLNSPYTASNNPTITETIPPGKIFEVKIPIAGLGTIKSGQVFEADIFTSYKYVDGAITQEASGDMRAKSS